MSWREATVADLLGRPATPGRRRRVARSTTPWAEGLLELMRTATTVALVSVSALVLAVPLVTAVPALAAGSRLLARERAGERVRPLRDLAVEVRRTTPTAWPAGPAVAAVVAVAAMNLTFLADRPAAVAAVLWGVNVAAAVLGLLAGAAVVRELADDPLAGRRELAARATARVLRLGRWHFAVLLGAATGTALLVLAPLLGAVTAPGLAILLGRLADPRPVRPERPIP